MKNEPSDKNLDDLVLKLGGIWKGPEDTVLLARTIHALGESHDLARKISQEPGTADILIQMFSRLANSFKSLADLEEKRVLDIACGSNTSRLPPLLVVKTPLGKIPVGRSHTGYTALFEPWLCRILLELGATPVGIDFGDLEKEAFIHYRVDLGQPGALDFLPDHSFDAVQDSRLFGSPEFTAKFPNPADDIKIAEEISRQEQRLLKENGLIIHSDARAILNNY